MNINQELKQLYDPKWDKLYPELLNIKEKGFKESCNPLMLCVKDEKDFVDADVRVMFFGRETSGGEWRLSDITTKSSVDEIMKNCLVFFDNEKGSGKIVDGKWEPRNIGMGGRMNLFKKMLEKKYPNKKIRYVWNNIVKSGNPNGTYPATNIRNAVLEHFNVIKDEIRIMKPDIILFATGTEGYKDIDRQFGKLDYQEVQPFHINRLCKVTLPEFSSVKYAFRMWHWTKIGKDNFEAILKEITI